MYAVPKSSMASQADISSTADEWSYDGAAAKEVRPPGLDRIQLASRNFSTWPHYFSVQQRLPNDRFKTFLDPQIGVLVL